MLSIFQVGINLNAWWLWVTANVLYRLVYNQLITTGQLPASPWWVPNTYSKFEHQKKNQ